MNKQDLIKHIADTADVSQQVAAKVLDATLEGITASLKSGDPVTLVGFGKFDVSDRAEREGRNPLTGEKIKISARRAAKFTAGQALKDSINK